MLGAMESICKGATLAHHDSTLLEMEPRQSPDGTKVRRIYDPCTHYDVFRDLAGGNKLVDCMVQLLGPDVVFFSSKINVKPAEIGSIVEWHQDMAYGPLTNRSVVAVLVYLDDADLSNAYFLNAEDCSFRKATLFKGWLGFGDHNTYRTCDFTGANLAQFRGEDCSFPNCIFENADLSDGQLE